MLSAPVEFEGSCEQLYSQLIEPNLPLVDRVVEFDDWMCRYAIDPDAIFPLRVVKGTNRRQISTTSDGTKFAPADNSPAWVVHAKLMEESLGSYEDFVRLMAGMPTHMFDISKVVSVTANSFGWYVAHILPAKNGDTAFLNWPRAEVVRRFFLTLHPCNLFVVPGRRNRKLGEDAQFINFIASQYAYRYGSTWSRFLRRIEAKPSSLAAHAGSDLISYKLAN